MQQDICYVIGTWLICSLAVERITEIITAGDLFAELRAWLGTKANPMLPPPAEEHVEVILPAPADERNKAVQFLWKKVSKLFSCGFCMSTWVSAAVAFALPDTTNILIKIFALMFFANVIHVIYNLLQKGRVKTHDVLLTVKEIEYQSLADDIEDDDDGAV